MAQHSPLHILQDSGAPEGSTDYITLVLTHGYGWHSGIFVKLIPLAHQNNARVVLVNRRDYPGSIPYKEDDRVLLQYASANASTNPAAAREKLVEFMKERAREVYDFLVRLVAEQDIPRADAQKGTGGIVLAGWSLGAAWVTALLANVSSFQDNASDLSAYILRVVLHDAPYHVLGYPLLKDSYNPLFDTSLPPKDVLPTFACWVSGFFDHGDLFSAPRLSTRTWLADPPPTISTLTPQERATAVCAFPGNPGGSDALLLMSGIESGAFRVLREAALFSEPGATDSDAWRGVEVRYVWCDRSIWDVVQGVVNLRDELRDVRVRQLGGSRTEVRDVTFVRVRGANHYVHWNEPERAMEALLAPAAAVAEEPI